MRFIFFYIPLLLLFANCDSKERETTISEPEPGTPLTLRYLALGDSYTIGERVFVEERFPHQMTAKLQDDDFSINFPVYVAQTGWTTSDLLEGIEGANINAPFDLVSICIGVNNQFSGMPIVDYEVEFEALIEKAIEFANDDKSKVIILSIPDYAYSVYGQSFPSHEAISTEIDEYNVVNKTIAESYEIQYFDITPISRQGLEEPELISSDNLHPSAEQYRRWVNLIYNDVKKIVEK